MSTLLSSSQYPSFRSSLVSLFGNSSSAKAINYSAMAKQASTVMAAAQKGDYSGCLPLLGVSSLAPGGPSCRWNVHAGCSAGCQAALPLLGVSAVRWVVAWLLPLPLPLLLLLLGEMLPYPTRLL